MSAGLGDDLNAALDQPALAPVRFEGFERYAGLSLRISSMASMMSMSRGTGDDGTIRTLAALTPRSDPAEPGASYAWS
jgi:hypothetical protein